MEEFEKYIVQRENLYETKNKVSLKSSIISVCAAVVGGTLLGLALDPSPVSWAMAFGASGLAGTLSFLFTGWTQVSTGKVIGERVKVRLNGMTFEQYHKLVKMCQVRISDLEYDSKSGEFFVWCFFIE